MAAAEQSEYAKRIFKNELNGSDAYTRHKKLINDYILFYGRNPSKNSSEIANTVKTELDVLKENHKFIRDPDEDESSATWEQRVAKKYYNKLFKEYAICELKHYKEGKIALRWRTQKEVVSGKGQFACASTRCEETTSLRSWEVNFAYMEAEERRNALVKVRLCSRCSDRLNYRTQRELAKSEKEKKKEEKGRRRRKRRESRNEEGSESDEKESEGGEKRKREKKRRLEGSDSDSDSNYERKEDTDSKDKGKDKAKEDASEIWSRSVTASVEDKSRTEEMEDYFADLLS